MTTTARFQPRMSPHHGTQMTLAEIEALPEEKPYLEYWDGVVVQKAVAGTDHGMLQVWVGAQLLA